jgi:hypothetical protein
VTWVVIAHLGLPKIPVIKLPVLVSLQAGGVRAIEGVGGDFI